MNTDAKKKKTSFSYQLTHFFKKILAKTRTQNWVFLYLEIVLASLHSKPLYAVSHYRKRRLGPHFLFLYQSLE